VKSDVSDFLDLLEVVYKDATSRCTADVSDVRDLRTIRSRVEHEGLSFLTITLPEFCKGFEAALEFGRILPEWKATYFRRFKFHRGGPVFLRGFLSKLFDFETGRLLDENFHQHPDSLPASIVEVVRQLCLLFKKIEVPCSPKREAKAAENFYQTELELSTASASPSDRDYFLRVSDVLWGNLVYHLFDVDLTPRHGPGATQERTSGNSKYLLERWYERLDNFFPLLENGFVLSAYSSKEYEAVHLVPGNEESPVRVTFVPKTLKAPRVIAIEPVCMQYAQQAIRDRLYALLESYDLTAGHVNFSDQSVNKRLAMASSDDGRLATIDLSDASDRVPHDLAMGMFRLCPERGAIDACRSRRAELPDGRIIDLTKFASMGSALCFPVESMYFYTICVAALLTLHSLPVTRANIKLVSRDIYVYGDDIIVPADAAEACLESLRKYFCKPNASKTFYRGSFRESCGMDAYQGREVTPIYLRKIVPRTRQDYTGLVSWSATANLFYKKGYFRTAEYLHCKVESILRVYPEVSLESAGVGRIYRTLSQVVPTKYRYNKRTQVREIRAWVVKPVFISDRLDGYGALTKCLRRSNSSVGTSLEERSKGLYNFPIDPLHLERTAMHGACTLKLRWIPAP